MNRKAITFATLGTAFSALAIEEFFGMIHGDDMCWLGNGEPFNGQPCPKNFIADPLRMFFANLWVRLSAFVANQSWGVPLFDAMMIGTVAGAMTFFYLAARDRQPT